MDQNGRCGSRGSRHPLSLTLPPTLPRTPGKLQPDSGVREVGETAVIGYFEQHPPPVDPSLRLVDYVRS